MRYAVIGGTGLNRLAEAVAESAVSIETPYGPASARPQEARLASGTELVFLARHGQPHRIPPHAINYRANMWLLHALGVDAVVASFAVGGIADELADTDIVVPHQIIDYTWGRAHTFRDVHDLKHVDFTEPFDSHLRAELAAAAAEVALPGALVTEGVYGATQGPRLESAAEIDRMERDGCTVVGMTAMPEAGLARELDMPYVGICLVVNKAAGRAEGRIESATIQRAVADGMRGVSASLIRFFERLG